MDFLSLGLAPRLVAALEAQAFTHPTPIQREAIPPALLGRDVLGLARTGSGKTVAFGLPMLDALLKEGQKPRPKSARALVLAPTRELARQIHDALAPFVQGSHLKLALVTGGLGFTPQIERMSKGVAVLVATPGRLLDLLDRGAIDLSSTRFLVIDEADQMLDLGFIHALRRIAPLLPADRQAMLFSATMPKAMAEVAGAFLKDPVRIEVDVPGQAAPRIEQSLHFVAQAAKADLLAELLATHPEGRALVFGRTKHGSEKLARKLEGRGFAVASLHGNKSQGQRDRAIAAFRAGDVKVLVATDVAARGIDIAGVEVIYNHDLPNVAETYVHRIGRTARAGASGAAVSLVAPDEMGELRAIEKSIKAQIPVASGAPWEVVAEPKARPAAKPGHRGGGPRPQRAAPGAGAGAAARGDRPQRPRGPKPAQKGGGGAPRRAEGGARPQGRPGGARQGRPAGRARQDA